MRVSEREWEREKKKTHAILLTLLKLTFRCNVLSVFNEFLGRKIFMQLICTQTRLLLSICVCVRYYMYISLSLSLERDLINVSLLYFSWFLHKITKKKKSNVYTCDVRLYNGHLQFMNFQWFFNILMLRKSWILINSMI